MMTDATKTAIDGLSISTILLSLLEKMPEIAALVALVWTLIRIYETHTIQRWLGKRERRSSDNKKEE